MYDASPKLHAYTHAYVNDMAVHMYVNIPAKLWVNRNCTEEDSNSGPSTASPSTTTTRVVGESEEEITDEEVEDNAAKMRRKLGLPGYNPDSALVDSLPSILPLCPNLLNQPT